MGKKHVGVLSLLGMGLIACGVCLLLYFSVVPRIALQRAQAVAAKIEALLPERSSGIPGLYADASMAVLQVEGVDYIALVEVPAFGVTLPVSSQWDPGKLTASPCRFWGSAYENTLVIGGSGQQFDFCSRIDPGALVTVTDMTGAEFTYTVDLVQRAKHADTHWLLEEGYALTLFARDPFSMEYLAVRCSTP